MQKNKETHPLNYLGHRRTWYPTIWISGTSSITEHVLRQLLLIPTAPKVILNLAEFYASYSAVTRKNSYNHADGRLTKTEKDFSHSRIHRSE